MSINYQDKFSRLSTSLADVITCINHVHSAHIEATIKIKKIRALGIKARVNELDKANEAISIVRDKIADMLKMTGYKSYVNYSKD